MCEDLKQNKTKRKPNSHLRIPRCRTRYSDNDNRGRAVWGWPLQLWHFTVRGHGWGVRLAIVVLHGWAENAAASWPAQGPLQLLKYSWRLRVCRGGSSRKSQSGCEWMLRKLTDMVVVREEGSQKVWNLWGERVNHMKSVHGDRQEEPMWLEAEALGCLKNRTGVECWVAAHWSHALNWMPDEVITYIFLLLNKTQDSDINPDWWEK